MLVVLASFCSFGQTDTMLIESPIAEDPDSFHIYEINAVDQNPIFKGGEAALIKFISDNIRYPEYAKSKGIEATVVVQYVVDKQGEVTNLLVITPERGGGLDEEAIRVVRLTSGKWIPAIYNKQPVRTIARIPIKFALK